MASINYLRAIDGEQLKRTTCKITDEQIILAEPKTVEILIWRNDERREKKFELQIQMPSGYIYTIAQYDTEEKAETAYEKLVEQLKTGKAKIKIGKSISVIFY